MPQKPHKNLKGFSRASQERRQNSQTVGELCRGTLHSANLSPYWPRAAIHHLVFGNFSCCQAFSFTRTCIRASRTLCVPVSCGRGPPSPMLHLCLTAPSSLEVFCVLCESFLHCQLKYRISLLLIHQCGFLCSTRLSTSWGHFVLPASSNLPSHPLFLSTNTGTIFLSFSWTNRPFSHPRNPLLFQDARIWPSLRSLHTFAHSTYPLPGFFTCSYLSSFCFSQSEEQLLFGLL